MFTQKKILVTGGAGFIGANLVRTLYHDNQVAVLVRPGSRLWRLKDIREHFSLHVHNMLEFASLKRLVTSIKPHIIYHMASYGNSSFHQDVQRMVYTNLVGTTNLLLSMKDMDFECFVNTGSSSEYGFKSRPMRERDLLEPVSFYAATKAGGTLFSQVYAKLYKKPVFTVRPFSIYGPYEAPNRLIPVVVTRALLNHHVDLTPNVARRDYIHVDDVVSFYLMLPEKIHQAKHAVYNLGTGNQFTNQQIVETIFTILGKKTKIKIGKYKNRDWDTQFWVSDNTRVSEDFNWNPRETISSGLVKTIEWFKYYKGFKKYYADVA